MREYDAIMTTLETMRDLLTAVHATLSKPKESEWESMTDALRLRRKGRAAIMEQVTAGRIRVLRVPARGGVDGYLLKTEDLDRLFPVRPPKK